MGNKINKSAAALRDQIEVRNLLINADRMNVVANKLVTSMSINILNHASSLVKKCTEVQYGAIDRGLTFSPIHDFRLSGQNVERFLASYKAGRDAGVFIRAFKFTHCDGEQVILNESEVEWLADRLQIDNLIMVSKELA